MTPLPLQDHSESPQQKFSQDERVQAVQDWLDRTYSRVDDPKAVAVFARKEKAGTKKEKWHQSFAPLEEFLADHASGQQMIPAVFEQDMTDCYAGLTLYWKDWRCASTVRWIPSAFVDLDAYTKGYDDPEKVKSHVNEICRAHGIPEPTDYTFTGRGLLARWQLDPLRAWPENLAMWDEVQRKLCDVFKNIGADHNARDCARVSRPDGTINSKSGKIVWSEKASGDIYNLDELAIALNVLVKPRSNRHAKKSKHRYQSKTIGVLVPKNPERFTLSVEGLRRMADLTELVIIRGAIEEGSRWNFLVAFAHSKNLTMYQKREEESDPDSKEKREKNILLHAHFFNDGFAKPLKNPEVKRAVAQGLRGFNFPSATIAERLQITTDEQAHMTTLVSRMERERRRIVRQRESETAKEILVAFEKHPGSRQIDLAEITGYRQGTVSKNLFVLGLRTQPKIDFRGKNRGFLIARKANKNAG